jgi:hypothetical protein
MSHMTAAHITVAARVAMAAHITAAAHVAMAAHITAAAHVAMAALDTTTMHDDDKGRRLWYVFFFLIHCLFYLY